MLLLAFGVIVGVVLLVGKSRMSFTLKPKVRSLAEQPEAPLAAAVVSIFMMDKTLTVYDDKDGGQYIQCDG